MSSDSTDAGEVPHYAYPVLRICPPFPTEIPVLCHHADTNDILLLGGRVSFRIFSQILLLGQCEHFWDNCEIFHWLLIVL